MPNIDTSAIEEVMQKSWGKMTLEQLLTALLLLVICLIAMKLVMTLLRRLSGRSKMDERVRRYLLGGVKAVLLAVTVLIVAQSLGIPVTSLIALVSVLGLAVSLAVQDVLSNVAGGMVILFSKPFSIGARIGDYVETTDGEGTVVEISLTHTKLDTYGGQRVMLPNKAVVDGKIINYSARGVRRVDHTITASYDDSTEAVRAACLRAVSRTPYVLADPAPAAVLTAYKDSAVEYHVRFWAEIDHFWDAYSFSLEEIRRCFAEDGVTMTYNHLNVHILDKTTEK